MESALSTDAGNSDQALLYSAAARGFLEACRGLVLIAEPKPMNHWPAFYLNLGYALELASKAVLSSKGVSNAELKRIEHDLEKLTKLIEAYGISIDDSAKKVIMMLNPDFRGQRLRYLFGSDNFRLPSDPKQAESIVAKYLDTMIAHAESQTRSFPRHPRARVLPPNPAVPAES